MPQQGNAASCLCREFWSEMAVPSSAGIRALEGNTCRKCHSTLRRIGRLCRWHETIKALRNLLTLDEAARVCCDGEPQTADFEVVWPLRRIAA